MGLKVVVAQPKLVGQQGFVPSGIDHVIGGIDCAFARGYFYTVREEGNILDGGVLQNCCAIRNGRCHHEIISILPVKVQLVAVRLLRDYRLQGALFVMRLPGGMVQKAEMALDAVGGAVKSGKIL